MGILQQGALTRVERGDGSWFAVNCIWGELCGS
jgi:hypothetical protein